MSATTLCPTCNTRFRITAEQLESHNGLVRCGRCHGIFDASRHLQDDVPSPQLDLPIPLSEELPSIENEPTLNLSPGQLEKEGLTVGIEPPDFELPALETDEDGRPAEVEAPAFELPVRESEGVDQPAEAGPPAFELTEKEPDDEDQIVETEAPVFELPVREHEEEIEEQEQPAPVITLAQKMTFSHVPEEVFARASEEESKPRWPLMTGVALLVLVLLGQFAYFYRVPLAASAPGLKPALTVYCKLLACSVSLPRQIDLISIESSNLEADPDQLNVITLNAVLLNHAPYVQAYPSLELTLMTDDNHPVARRTFNPADYLPLNYIEQNGIVSNREVNISLNLDTTDLNATGYRLFLYYPI